MVSGDEESDGEAQPTRRSQSSSEDEEEDLHEDRELINDNLGVTKRVGKRVARVESDEDVEQDDRNRIQADLFDSDDSDAPDRVSHI